MKIGIVNDLPIAAEALRRAVALEPEYQVTWVAHDGAEAVALCAETTPHLILMDLIMPGMNGIEATRQIMARTPCAILIVTANVGTNATGVYQAMGHGALDAVDTPAFNPKNPRSGAAALLAKIDSIRRRIDISNDTLRAAKLVFAGEPTPQAERLIAIGASAGGPAALAQLLSGLPRDFPAAIVIVQHVDPQFAAGLAGWLSQLSPLPVAVAREGDRPTRGSVLLAGTGDHLTLTAAGLSLSYTREPSDYVYRPSVDVFFRSVRDFWPSVAVGVLLTGMGRDGAVGLKALRDAGCHTIAQDEATSAVYGMPKAAALLGAAIDILPINQIAPRLIDISRSDSPKG
jgi:two-component system, chemotaxis family, response regulator WspF